MSGKDQFGPLKACYDCAADLCGDAIHDDRPWMAVVAFHEIARRTYPVDNYYRSRPRKTSVAEMTAVLDAQEKWLRAGAAAVDAYPLADVLASHRDDSPDLETRTHRLYGSLWQRFDPDQILAEAKRQLDARLLPNGISEADLKGKRVLDLGCGSGRFTVGLEQYGAEVTGVDMGDEGLAVARGFAERLGIANIRFERHNILSLGLPDASFDFVFCNGVLHHTRDWKKGLREMRRMLKPGGRAFLYLYARGGLFWYSRRRIREIIRDVPRAYSAKVLDLIGLPRNRFVFMDSWYVPVEDHIGRDELEDELRDCGYREIAKTRAGGCEFDLDLALRGFGDEGPVLFGEGEHRYVLTL